MPFRRIVLLLVPWLILGWLSFSGRLSPTYEPDSASYTNFDWSSLDISLTRIRTCGYPLFLRWCALFGEGERAVPFMQWAAAMLAAWCLYWGLCQVGYRFDVAAVCATTAMLSRGLLDYSQLVLSESLAVSLLIACSGCFLATLATGRRIGAWTSLMLLTVAAWQTRPACLFLVVLWPVLGLLLDKLVLRRDETWRQRWRRMLGYVAITWTPLLAFCTLRLVVVGHFGVVSFTGYHTIGIAGQFLDAPLLADLSPEVKPIAQEILNRRKLIEFAPPNDFLSMESMFDPTVYRLAIPAANASHPHDPVALDNSLMRLSLEVFRERPGPYLRWLRWNARHAVQRIILLTAFDRGTLLLVGGVLLLHARRCLRGSPGTTAEIPNLSPQEATKVSRQLFIEQHLLLWIALGLAVFKVMLVLGVQPANDRYMTGAMPLLPSALAIFIAQQFVPHKSEDS
ncbi:MAG: hypothetical protein R3C01_10990 [Planctomycetaceae bacterium]